LTQCDTALAGFAFRHSRAGAKPLFVDLSSAAVGVLAEACDRAARRWSACRSPSKGPHGTPSVDTRRRRPNTVHPIGGVRPYLVCDDDASVNSTRDGP